MKRRQKAGGVYGVREMSWVGSVKRRLQYNTYTIATSSLVARGAVKLSSSLLLFFDFFFSFLCVVCFDCYAEMR